MGGYSYQKECERRSLKFGLGALREDEAGEDKDLSRNAQGRLGSLSHPGGHEELLKGFWERK